MCLSRGAAGTCSVDRSLDSASSDRRKERCNDMNHIAPERVLQASTTETQHNVSCINHDVLSKKPFKV